MHSWHPAPPITPTCRNGLTTRGATRFGGSHSHWPNLFSHQARPAAGPHLTPNRSLLSPSLLTPNSSLLTPPCPHRPDHFCIVDCFRSDECSCVLSVGPSPTLLWARALGPVMKACLWRATTATVGPGQCRSCCWEQLGPSPSGPVAQTQHTVTVGLVSAGMLVVRGVLVLGVLEGKGENTTGPV